MSSLDTLKSRMKDIVHLRELGALASWDQQCYMPSGAAPVRAEQMAVIAKYTHEMFTADETGRLIEDAASETGGLDYDSDDASLVRYLQWAFDRATKLPADLVTEESRETTLAHEVWVQARKDDNFKHFLPSLERIVDICQRKAECYGYEEELYDALLEDYEPGVKTREVEQVFSEIRPGLVSLVKEISESSAAVDGGIMTRFYPKEQQIELTNDVVQLIGFRFANGRQDQAPHPFCTNFGIADVRLTTRFDENYLPGSLFASMHEAGHGMYEQNSPAKWEGNPIAGGTSLGVHESQSRMWENQVGRSRAFINYYFPRLQEFFPEALSNVSPEDFYKAANNVRPSLIRVEADEVTYGLHIMLRFDLEQKMMKGEVDLKELPDLWNSKMQEYLGITPPNDADGVLQDVHWSSGIFGYFPTYLLGTIISAQLWQKMLSDNPSTYDQFEKGEFKPTLDWLVEHVHRHGKKYQPKELLERIVGGGLDSKPMLDYLRTKYSDIYQLHAGTPA